MDILPSVSINRSIIYNFFDFLINLWYNIKKRIKNALELEGTDKKAMILRYKVATR